MNKHILYLMLGYPGAGKTTVAKVIAGRTGAVHIWADHERRAMFESPTHSKDESDQLYAKLNEQTDELLKKGQSVIFDTSFNHFKDREHLRRIAARNGAAVKLVWLNTPLETAKQRATHIDHANHNKYAETMPLEEFKRIASHLEPPRPVENAVEIDGTDLNQSLILQKLNLG